MSQYGGLINKDDEDYEYYNLSQKLNPDIPYDSLKSWGCLIHPDEIRKIWFYGNGKFASTSGSTFENYQLKNWIDLYVENFQNIIQWEIYPRLFRHRPVTVPGAVNRQIEDFAEYEDAYDFNQNNPSMHSLSLRHRPIYRVLKWSMINPYNGSQMIDLSKRMTIKHNTGNLRSTYILPYYGYGAGSAMTIPVNQYRISGSQIIPNSYLVDYSTGYESAKHVPRELIVFLVKEISISIMSAFGDGIVAGAASYSTSLSGISESLSTTMSATSAYFGARIQQLSGENKEWINKFKAKYTGLRIGFI